MTDHSKNDSRSGIAIIIVLGVLAVMIVLAVAFAVSMRTEKTAAGYYAQIAKTRDLVHTALARAMADLEQDLAAGSAGGSYPAYWSVQAMDSNTANAVHLYIGEAKELLPEGIYEAAAKLPSPGTIFGGVDSNASWNINGLAGFGIQDIGGASGTVLNNQEHSLNADIPVAGSYRIYDPAVPLWSRVEDGRIAYLIVNLSGLLDAHFVGDDVTPRQAGSSLLEIDVSQLSDMPDMVTLVAARSTPFESLPEMEMYGGFSTSPRNWCDYSRYPAAVDGSTPAVVSGSESSLDAVAIKDAFSRSMALINDTFQSEFLYANLYDYVDADNVPGSITGGDGTQGPYVEAVPMVNEVYATNTITIDGGGTISGGLLLVSLETFYPFVNAPSGSFEMTYDISVIADPSMPTITPMGALPATVTLSPTPESYTPITAVFMVTGTNVPSGITFGLEIDAEIVDTSEAGDPPVDRIPTVALSIVVPPIANGETGGDGDGHDVIDPRVNWAAAHWANPAPFTYEPTVGAINSSATQFMTFNTPDLDTDDVQQDTSMYVANAPLQSVGELGYLFAPGGVVSLLYMFKTDGTPLSGAPGPWLWRTVRLYDHGSGEWDRVLDHFAMTNAVTTANGDVFMGPVNPNSEVTDALAAVFYKMRKGDRYYGDPSLTNTPVLWSSAVDLAARIQDYTYDAPFEWLSDMGQAGCATNVFDELGVATGTELQKEGFYRNAASLLHTRQNLFLILLAGQTANDPSTFGPPWGVPRTDQRAMAVVWRDPVADANGHHRSFVRWFDWLEK
jgi:hypothetical protein